MKYNTKEIVLAMWIIGAALLTLMEKFGFISYAYPSLLQFVFLCLPCLCLILITDKRDLIALATITSQAFFVWEVFFT